MSRVKKSFMLVVLSFSLAACLQKPVTSVEVLQTPTSAPSTLPIPVEASATVTSVPATLAAPVEASPTAIPLPLPTLPTPLQVSSTPDASFSPVFLTSKDGDSLLLLGGVKEDRGWLSAENAASYVSSGVDYDFYSASSSIQARGGVLEFSPTCRAHFMRSSTVMPDRMVGVAGGWSPAQRGARDLATDDPAYVQAVGEWFQSRGNVPPEVHITRILQADIEGDGVDEVLLSLSYFRDVSGHMSETGDYSFVLLRKVLGNTVLTIPVTGEYYVSGAPELSYPHTYTVGNAVDLNRDGTLEVVVEVSRWEGGGGIVFQVEGQNVREVMRAVC